MSDLGYCILSARYANPEHTAVVAETLEAGSVAASSRDRPALWQRIHNTVPVAPHDPQTMPANAAPLPELPAPLEQPPVITVNDQGDRRRAARALVEEAVAQVNRLTNSEQLRYELALMVVNQNIEAMSDLKDAAAAAGLPVVEYAKRAIAVHTARRRRAAQVYASEERALKDIDQATGDEIEAVAERAVKDIRGET